VKLFSSKNDEKDDENLTDDKNNEEVKK